VITDAAMRLQASPEYYFTRVNEHSKIFGPFKSKDVATTAYNEYVALKHTPRVA